MPEAGQEMRDGDDGHRDARAPTAALEPEPLQVAVGGAANEATKDAAKEAAHQPAHPRDDTIVDRYKGMEIRIRTRRFGQDAWTCTIRICGAPQRALQSVGATLRTTDAGASRQAALAFAFLEAMTLCDLILERKTGN